jgi:hypothetical protein
MPIAGGLAPVARMTLTSQLVDAGTVEAVLIGFSAVPLRWRHEPDAVVAVLIVVPIDDYCNPVVGLFGALEKMPRIDRPIFPCAKQRLRVGYCSCSPSVWSRIGSDPSSGVTQEVLLPFLRGEQEHSVDDCLEVDCAAPPNHFKPGSLNIQFRDREDLSRSAV